MPQSYLLRFAAVALATVAASAWADSNTPSGRPGFFQPTPDGDPALKPAPGASGIVVAPQPPATSATAQAATNAQTEEALRKEAAVRKADAEIDRAEREHEKMTEKSRETPTTIQGAFTGLTSERDR
jgi:hypothetical protein